MAQTYTSARTSINSKRLPAVFKKVPLTQDGFLLDYGCGKHVDHVRSAVTAAGMVYLAYDPYNQSAETNKATMDLVRWASAHDKPITVVCSNVLNVIDDDGTVRFIADQIETIVERTGGTAYITVYDGDGTGIGRQTGPDQYQRNESLREYLKYFRDAVMKKGMIVVS